MNSAIYILVILAVVWFLYINQISNLLDGFWEADKDFCNECDLDMFCVYFGNKDFWGKRGGYVFASKQNNIKLNEPVTMTITPEYLVSPLITGVKTYDVIFKGISEDVVEVFPARQKIKLYPACGKLILYYKNTITAVLYKNCANSEIKNISQD
jgi:hypothetical protein